MKHLLPTLCFFTVGLSAHSQALTPTFHPRADVYQVADSIRQTLIAEGVDTIILHYHTRYWHPIKTSDGMEQWLTAFLFWMKGSTIGYQWVGPFAISRAKTDGRRESDLGHLFTFYQLNSHAIDTDTLPFRSHFLDREPGPITKRSLEKMDYQVLSYHFGSVQRTVDWASQKLRTESTANDFAAAHSPLHWWVTMIENAFRNALDERWLPLNMKAADTRDLVNEFVTMITKTKEEQKQRDKDYEKFHTFDKQEIEIPASVRGLVTIVQKADCGERLKIKNKIRVIRIPATRVLILKENYIDFYRELFTESDRANTNTTFYQVNGGTRQAIPVLNRGVSIDVNELGIYMQLLGTHEDDKGKYNLIKFFVGTYTELEELGPWGHMNRDTPGVIEALKRCR